MARDGEVEGLVRMYENGRIDRRRLLHALTAMVAVSGAAPAAAQGIKTTPAPGKGALALSQKAALHHVELKSIQTATNLTRTRDFYQELFGVPADLRKDRVVLELPGGTYLSVGQSQTQASIDHFAFGVVEDKKAIVDKLKAAGYRFDQPRDSFITDPDGRQIQIVHFEETV